MNKNTYRLVYSGLRRMVVAVAETATAARKSASGQTCARRCSRALAAVSLLGALPAAAFAQIAPTPGTPTQVIQTPNGLPQVNIAAPSGAGVSVNTYNQFDVQRNGAILNNSPTMVQTQQAGYINGNPNFAAGQSARIIVNQVNSTAASQLRGYVEIAGNRAQVVLANPAGIVVDGGGFINTSRATLTTGQPYYGADGSLAGYNVNRGLITVQGAGLNAANVDQVDLISRAVQANAAIYAKNLNVVTGANQVNHDTLSTTAIQGDGAAAGVSIDVSQLGGMYADRITLVGTERGVGVSNAGVLAAHAGDLTLQSNGQLVLAGKTNASGNLNLAAQDGIQNSGTTYGAQNVSVATGGALQNGGTLAAQRNLDVTAASVASSGTLGAGVNADSSVGPSGDLNVTSIGQLSATGKNVAGGTLSFTGAGIDLSGAQTAANGGVSLRAQAGELDLSGAATSARGAIDAHAAGAVRNDRGTMSSAAGIAIEAGSVSNQSGLISAAGPLTVRASHALANQGGTFVTDGALALNAGDIFNHQGTLQSGGALTASGASLDNTAGRIVSLGTGEDGDLSVTATGQVTNATGTTARGAQGGVIGGNGNVTVQAGSLANHGVLTAQRMLQVRTASLDNRDGLIAADRLAIKASDLKNAHGTVRQYGGQATVLDVSGTLDNSGGGAIETNGESLTLAPAVLNNAGGKIIHAGTGTFTLAPSAGTLTNTSGRIESRGEVMLTAAALDNTSGTIAAQRGLSATVAGTLTNAQGVLGSNGNVALTAASLVNTKGGQLSGASLSIRADDLNNSGGKIGTIATSGAAIRNAGNGDIAITTTGALSNADGSIGATRNLAITSSTLFGGGTYSAANDLTLALQGDFTNTPDYEFNAGHNLAFTLPGTFRNAGGLMSVNDLSVDARGIVNSGAMAAGGWLRTNSNTLTNTGVLVGGSVSLAAASTLANVGPTALIGASDSDGTLELLANDIQNRDDTTATDTSALTAIYGMGRVVLAGGKDANGNYTNASRILNQSGLIQSGGDMALHADLVTNTRREMKTEWTSNVDAALLERLGISLSGRTGQVGVKDPLSIGGVYVEPPHGGEYQSTYQYTTYTGTAMANLITKISPAAQIVSMGNLDVSSVGMLQNYWSQVAAAGDMATAAAYDSNGWHATGQEAPQIRVTYTGKYWYRNYDGTKFWSYSFCNDPGCNAPADVKKNGLPDYASTLVANGTLSGTGVSINNPGSNASMPSLGLPPGVDVSKVGGGVDPLIASATAVSVLSNLTIPQGGLFKPTTVPGATYLIETNPAFTNQRSFMSSDYYLRQLGLNPDQIAKRLGDGFYEQQLVRNQITSLTGKAVLGPYTNIESMYGALLASGAALAQALNLPLGASLSAEQVAQLTSSVVLMETRIVDGQTVLVPVVYLAKADQQDMRNGPLIAARDIDLKNTQSFVNSGTVKATNSLSIDGASIDNRYGTLQSGGLMALTTTGDVDLTSANVKAGSLFLNSGGDLILDTATKTTKQVNADGATRVNTTLGPIAQLDVAGDAAIITGGDFRQNAGALSVGGNLGMQIGGDWTLGTQEVGEHKVVARDQGISGISNTDIRSAVGSSVTVGGASAIAVGGDLTARGAQIDLGGGGTIAAQGNVSLLSASATSMVDSSSAGSGSGRSYAETYYSLDQTLTGTTLTGGDTVNIVSGKDITLQGSAISLDKGNANLLAAGDVTIGAASETHALKTDETHSHSGVASGSKVASGIDQTATYSIGSMVSADGVNVVSGRDINVAGSTIVGTNDVALAAARDVTITTSQDTMRSSEYYQKKETGLMSGGGFAVSVGSQSTKDQQHSTSVINTSSNIGSLAGNLTIAAGNDLHVTGSNLIAAQNISGTGANVIIDAAQNSNHYDRTHEVSKSGVTVGLAGSVAESASNVVNQSRAASNSRDGRAAALHGVAAAGNAAMTVAGVTGGALAGPNPSLAVQVSVGSSHSKDTFSEDQMTHTGSSVMAGGTTAFVATGNPTGTSSGRGAPGSGNITIAGSNVSASDVILAAKNQINLINTTDTDSTRSTNEASSASVGVSFGTNGFGVSAAMSKAHGDGNSDAQIQNNTHVIGANSVTLVSGGDTNLIGANVSGNTVLAEIGGNLNVASVQDVTTSAAHQSSMGGGFSISQGGGSASFSASHGDASGSYVGVNEQAGIQAGDGGFNINVKGNTDLTGAYITSAADAEKNSLSTGTLTFSDLQNHSDYSASSSGFSAGAVSGAGGVTPMLSQHDSGSESAVTQSGIGAGTINITDQANQTQDLASLNRETSNLNGTMSKLPDVKELLADQADMMSAVQAAGQVVAQGIGAYADQKQKEAQANAKMAADTGNPELAAQWQAQADTWSEGGANRIALHVGGGALIGGLGGGGIGTAAQGAAGAGLAAASAGKLNGLADNVGDATGSPTLGNIASNAIAGAGGFLIGGSAGAVTAANADLYNRQLHPEEKKWINEKEAAYAKRYGLTLEQAHNELTTQANLQVQNGSPGTWNQRASEFLNQAHGMLPADGNSGPGYMFYATPDQKANPNIYAGYYSNGVGLNKPAAGDIANSVNREAAYRDAYTKGTWAAAGAAAGLALAGPAAAIPGVPIFSSGGALGSGAWASPMGTGVISAGINVGAQYAQNGTVNPLDVASAFATGAGGTYGGLLWNVGVNAAGGATTVLLNNILQGKNDSAIGAGITAGLFSSLGYGIGKLGESTFNSAIRPTINNSGGWAGSGAWSGSGWNMFRPNGAGVVVGTTAGGMGQEVTNSAAGNLPGISGGKK
ncbi:filamentous hemagglutinin N-terminal domain-containing protein [Trinickia violacea]|uniref:Filamentous hemagglutinin N-terminal domain-containing protein n=1 Tax=Trinickia violacea TaxID=2571746 RepID=A0A4P8IR63_9BURK|nr:hemagglutinin repeat-containing protein [Trinickia violacea]QCP50846.1 filamentous hemagglutinin N-terminal domain-containing protein [Trinickia violacea]